MNEAIRRGFSYCIMSVSDSLHGVDLKPLKTISYSLLLLTESALANHALTGPLLLSKRLRCERKVNCSAPPEPDPYSEPWLRFTPDNTTGGLYSLCAGKGADLRLRLVLLGVLAQGRRTVEGVSADVAQVLRLPCWTDTHA